MGTHWRDVYKTSHTSAIDVPNGTYVLEKVWDSQETFEGGEKKQVILAKISGFEKPIILNRKNSRLLHMMTGKANHNDWSGFSITLEVVDRTIGKEKTKGFKITDVIKPTGKQDNSAYIGSIQACKSEDDLRALWSGLEKSVQNDPAVIAAKDAMKEKLSKGA